MDEKLQFVARRLAGEAMAELCREFGISRKTGYKIFDRYQECGVQGLTDRSRRPYRYAHQLPFQVQNFIRKCAEPVPSAGCSSLRELPFTSHARFGASPFAAGARLRPSTHQKNWWPKALMQLYEIRCIGAFCP